jgi:hypothetical protein
LNLVGYVEYKLQETTGIFFNGKGFLKMKNIKARVKRNKLDELAGIYYKDENSGIVKHLNSINKVALLGIQRGDGIYTIIGESWIYYLTVSGTAGKISHGNF